MPIYRPSELICFLKKIGSSPKKGLSQNFLIDGNIVAKLIKRANIKEDDQIVEIGPGPGVITEALLSSGFKVIAIEKDELLAKHLNRLQNGNLTIINKPFQEVIFENILCKSSNNKVISNTPYSISTLMIQKLVPLNDYIDSIFFMVQKEVAQRCVASKKTKDYSSFTLYTNFFSDPKILFDIPKSCFFPSPNIMSSAIEFKLKSNPLTPDYELLLNFIRLCFTKRRKMLKTTLKNFWSSDIIENALEVSNIHINARPEELSLVDFFTLQDQLRAAKA